MFCGTPEFAVPTLEAVIGAGHEVALVVTQPDRAAGRGMEVRVGAVKAAAVRHGIAVVQPEKIKNNVEFRGLLEELRPDVILVVAYGRIIPEWMLELPRHGNINLHGSLLPKYRGAAPIQWAIASGEAVTGLTTMRLDAGLDTGDMLLAQAVPIGQEETAVEVYERLAVAGAELMLRTLEGVREGTIVGKTQDHARASLAPILKREDGWIDFGRTAQQIYDRWRGFQPWPGAHTTVRGKKLIVARMRVVVHPVAHPEAHSKMGESGVLRVEGDSMMVGCGEGTVIALDEVQMEGKKRMTAGEFLRGYQVKSGERLGG